MTRLGTCCLGGLMRAQDPPCNWRPLCGVKGTAGTGHNHGFSVFSPPLPAPKQEMG